MPGRMDFGFQFSSPQGRPARQIREGAPRRIAVLGDFSGRAQRGLLESGPAIAGRTMPPVDIDNIEEVLSRLAPRAMVACLEQSLAPQAASAGDVTIGFSQLDDFHPDSLYDRVDVFEGLQTLRRRLLNSATFAQAAAELNIAVPEPRSAPKTPAAPPPPPTPSEGFSIEGLLDMTSADARRGANTPEAAFAQMISQIVAPYVEASDDPRQKVYVAAVDEAMSAQMRRILHDPAFQALEAAWRGLRWLLARLEEGETAKVRLLDISKAELAADLDAADDNLQTSGLYKLLVERGVQTAGGEPWSFLLGNYTFDSSEEDVRLLAALGAVASQAGGPFLAAASPEVLGVRNLAETPDPDDWEPLSGNALGRWQALRASAGASWLGLALPRFVLRLPYGKKTSPTERFPFEELTDGCGHEAFLWGNPAILCASFLAGPIQRNDLLEIDDLPAYYYQKDGETCLLPASEAYLSQRATDAIQQCGLMPLASYMNRNMVRLLRLQSLADPPTSLVGR